jgi:ribonuclease HII
MQEETRKHKTAALMLEADYAAIGYQHIFGLDEAGRGPWAGPLVVGAVCLPLDDPDLLTELHGVRDSKQMTPAQRQHAAEQIRIYARAWGIGEASVDEINAHGLTRATEIAMVRALADAEMRSKIKPDFLLLDYFKFRSFDAHRQASFKKGDSLSLSIAAASVLAKVHRDHLMVDVAAAEFPYFGFERHKGYGTAEHIRALQQYGITPLHRRNYAPIARLLEAQNESS